MFYFSLKKLSIFTFALFLMACSMTEQYGEKKKGVYLYSKSVSNDVGYISEKQFHHGSREAPANQTYYFEYDSSIIKPRYGASLTAQAAYLLDHPKARVLIEGHTDKHGTHKYNVGLAKRRANAIASFLKAEGVHSNQIKILSYSKERPINMEDNQVADAENRRANVIYENIG